MIFKKINMLNKLINILIQRIFSKYKNLYIIKIISKLVVFYKVNIFLIYNNWNYQK